MLTEIAEEISLRLVANKIITIDDRKYYTYGIELIINDTLIGLSITAIAVFTGNLITSLAYAVTYCLLRAYVGGYHCKSYAKCYVTTLSLYSTMLVLNYCIKDGKLIVSFILIIIASVAIFIFAPIEYGYGSPNQTDRKRYRKGACLFLILDIIAFCLTCLFHLFDISFAISWGVFMVFVLTIPFMDKNLLKVRKKHEKETNA